MEIDHLGEEYDYGSLMHYAKDAFAREKGLITVEGLRQGHEKMGQREGFSETDIRKINKLYECDGNSILPYCSFIIHTKFTVFPLLEPRGLIFGSVRLSATYCTAICGALIE